jgi:glutathione synthase
LKLIRSSFTGIYPLDDSPLGLDSYQRALECPGRFVLKPQREGGGNNFYGEQVRHKLLELSSEERSAYILMDRIQPAPFRNILVRQGEPVESSVVSELGVYGVYLADGEREIVNRSAGHLLRTKMSSTDEGGVASGFAVVDSPLLF